MELDEYLPVLRRDERPVRRRGGRGGAGARLDGARARLPRLDARRPRLAPGRGAALLGLGRAHPGRRTRRPTPSRPRRPDDELLGWRRRAERRAGDGARPAPTRPSGSGPGRRSRTSPSCCAGRSQEATVHTVDVEQVLGDVRPIPAAIGLDGLDEWLEVMVPGRAAGRPAGGRAPRRLPRRRRRRRADPVPRHPAVPDRRPHRHRRRPAAGGVAAACRWRCSPWTATRCRPPR